MSRVIDTLNQLEIRLQSLIEGSTTKLFPRNASSRQLAVLLEGAIQKGIHEGKNGERIAPNLFFLLFHPEQAAIIQKDPGWIDKLGTTLLEIEEFSDYVYISQPIVRVVASDELEFGQISVLAEFNTELTSETAGKPFDQRLEADESQLPGYLIVDGTDVFSLDQPVINIGRRTDNQLVLDDGRVSRLHAQIRVINQNHVIFDLDSSGGTWVNGARIHQHKLVPGDVISIAGVPLVFGQEMDGRGETADFRPVGSGGAGEE